MKKLKILFSLVGIFTVFSFANSSAIEKNPNGLNEKKQVELKKEKKHFPIEVDSNFNVIVLDFLEEDKYAYENGGIASGIAEFLRDFEAGENLDECFVFLKEILRKKKKIYFDLAEHYFNEYVGFEGYGDQQKNMRKSWHYGTKAEYYEYLEEIFNNCTPRFAFDDEFFYEKCGKFSGRVAIRIDDLTVEGLKYRDLLKKLLLRKNPNEIEAFRTIRMFAEIVMKKKLKKLRDVKLLERDCVVCVNKNLPIDLIFEDVEKEIARDIYKNNYVKFDYTAEDFGRFYEIAYLALTRYERKNKFMDYIYYDVFDPDNFESVELSKDSSKLIFKFKDEKIAEKYRMKLLNFSEYLKRPTNLSKITRLDQISIIPLLYIRFKQQNYIFKYSDNKLQDLE